MKQYIIIGVSSFLSCIFDIIHAQGGKVSKIYRNIPEEADNYSLGLKERIKLAGYDMEVFNSMESFSYMEGFEYVLGFVTVQKYKLIDQLKNDFGLQISNLIHPSAILGSNVSMGEGVTILPGVIIDTNVILDDYCTLNKGVIVGHEARIGKYSLIASAAAIASGASIGDKCFIGMNSSIIDNIKIKDWCVIGAGSVVIKNLDYGKVAVGNPASVKHDNSMINFEQYRAKRFPEILE